LRKVATQLEAGTATPPIQVAGGDVTKYLGRAKFHEEVAERTSVPGVATGLAVTGIGGEVLFVEAAAMDGQKGLTLTGQLGDVMKESAQIGLSYVRSHAADLPQSVRDAMTIHLASDVRQVLDWALEPKSTPLTQAA